MLALIPQSGDFSGAALGVRSVALLQVAKLPQNTIMRLKNGNKPHILRLKLVFLTAKVIFLQKILAYISQKL